MTLFVGGPSSGPSSPIYIPLQLPLSKKFPLSHRSLLATHHTPTTAAPDAHTHRFLNTERRNAMALPRTQQVGGSWFVTHCSMLTCHKRLAPSYNAGNLHCLRKLTSCTGRHNHLDSLDLDCNCTHYGITQAVH